MVLIHRLFQSFLALLFTVFVSTSAWSFPSDWQQGNYPTISQQNSVQINDLAFTERAPPLTVDNVTIAGVQFMGTGDVRVLYDVASLGGVSAFWQSSLAPNTGPRIIIRDHYAHHDAMRNDVIGQLRDQGYTVSQREVSFGSSCGSGRCRPDIIYETPDGQLGIIEIKTGNADLTIRQSEIYPQINSGDAIPRGQVAADFDLRPGVPLGERALAWCEKYLHETGPPFDLGGHDPAFFLTSLDEAFTPNRMTQLVRNHIVAAEIGKSGSCHLFRHSCATLMLENGADMSGNIGGICGCVAPFGSARAGISGIWTDSGRGLSSLVENDAAEVVAQVGHCHATESTRLAD